MRLLQKFASTALTVNKDFKDDTARSIAMGYASMVLAAPFGILAAHISDEIREIEAEPHANQQEALSIYDSALNSLKEQRDLYISEGGKSENPAVLSNILTSKQPIDVENQTKRRYDEMMQSYITALHIDDRLNEQDVQDLTTRFENVHGAVADVTDFSNIDYNDIREAREATPPSKGVSEQRRAEWINGLAASSRSDIGIGMTVGTITLLSYFLLAFIGGRFREPLTRIAEGKSRKTTKHGPH